KRALERLHRRSLPCGAEGRIPARGNPSAGVEYVVAQYDVLTRDVLLISAAAVVTTDHAAVGRRALGPVDVPILDRKLFRRVVAGRQARDEGSDLSGHGVDGDDARTVVLALGVCRLIGVTREEPPTAEALLERDVHGRPCRLEAAGRRGLGQGAQQGTALVEDEDVRCERVLRVERPGPEVVLLVADTRQAVSGLQHEDVESISMAKKGDAGREVQTRGEDRNLEACLEDYVAASARIEQRGILRAERVSLSRGARDGRQREGECNSEREA